MKSFPKIKKILWAVDAMQPVDRVLKNIAAQVEDFAKLCDARVEVAYAYRIPVIEMDRKALHVYEAPFQDALNKNLARIAKLIKAVPTTTALVNGSGTKSDASEIKLLLGHAARNDFDLVACATHARSTIVKLFIGSFADGLIRHSHMPLLLVGPHAKRPRKKKPERIVVPTDLSAHSHAFLKGLAAWLKTHGSSLILVHGVTNEYIPAALSDAHLMGGFYPMNSEVTRDIEQGREAKLKKLVNELQRHGIKAKGEIYSSGGLISDVVLHAVRRNRADFVIMETRTTSPAYASMGSVTKKMIRKGDVPVLVLKR